MCRRADEPQRRRARRWAGMGICERDAGDWILRRRVRRSMTLGEAQEEGGEGEHSTESRTGRGVGGIRGPGCPARVRPTASETFVAVCGDRLHPQMHASSNGLIRSTAPGPGGESLHERSRSISIKSTIIMISRSPPCLPSRSAGAQPLRSDPSGLVRSRQGLISTLAGLSNTETVRLYSL
ncbi:hypothetical protein CALCODRAFT_123748 [Calocera cornea HHB12733]|uniref:Uncharacterized protein n=1 Tax=Calocera cornea HHB12733 TaxID=1353952 RepID=A0A165CY66_9BASI|nr:hypothetical protein CALCODRAFT_123748 [Calocera cornea HHB12733]